jgi:hypothetical protein
VPSLFDFLSEMAQRGHIESYSAIRQNFVDRHVRTISYELYDEENGWVFDLKKDLAKLSRLARTATIRKRV